MKRSPLKRTASLSRRIALARESAEQRRTLRAWQRVKRAIHQRDGWTCQAAAKVPSVTCRGPLDGQHVIPRSTWAGGMLEGENVLSVCRAHHDWIGDHPLEAHALGLHGYSWEASA